MGGVILFLALDPLLGFLKSGIITCFLWILLGAGLLFIGRKQTRSPQEELSQKALEFLQSCDPEKGIKDHLLLISVVLFGVGIILSQMKNRISISDIYKIMNKSFLR